MLLIYYNMRVHLFFSILKLCERKDIFTPKYYREINSFHSMIKI